MIIFSRAKVGDTKVAYKGYQRVKGYMADLEDALRNYSVSSFVYKAGTTASGVHVEGHRANADIVEAGNVLLIDIDSKYVPVTFDELVAKLDGVSCYVAPSKGWSEELQKFHVAVEMWQPLPTDKDQFKRVYRAVCQQLGLDGLYDPAMESPSQQLAPHYRSDAPEMLIEGEPVDADAALAAYMEPEGAKGGAGLSGTLSRDTMFTLSSSGKRVGFDEMLDLVAGGKKVRVHCAAGLEHDGRRDTAFVSGAEDGGAIYHCAGGRCGHTLLMKPNPFSDEGGETVVEVVTANNVRQIIADHPVFSHAYTDKKPSVTFLKEAVSYAAQELLLARDLRYVEGEPCEFNGVYWQRAYRDPAQFFAFISDCFTQAGWVHLAYNNGATDDVKKYLLKFMPEAEGEARGEFLNTQNGVVEITMQGPRLLRHDKRYMFTYVLPYDFDPAAKAPYWERLVLKIMCGRADLVLSLQEAMGYLIIRGLNVEKMIAFVGEGSNGKSTIMEVLKMLVGLNGYSSVPIRKLLNAQSEGDYARAFVAGKIVNITNELTPSTIEADVFKDLITGRDMTARNPYGKPFTVPYMPKQLVAMNTTEQLVKERTHGFMRRLHLIPFEYTVTDADKDPQLMAKIEVELPGILNWCLEGAVRVLRNNTISVAEAGKELFENVERSANPVQQFLEDNYVEDDNAHVENDELYVAFVTFCDQNNYHRWGKIKFLNECRRLGLEEVAEKVSSGHGRRTVRGFKGALINNFTDSKVIEMRSWTKKAK